MIGRLCLIAFMTGAATALAQGSVAAQPRHELRSGDGERITRRAGDGDGELRSADTGRPDACRGGRQSDHRDPIAAPHAGAATGSASSARSGTSSTAASRMRTLTSEETPGSCIVTP